MDQLEDVVITAQRPRQLSPNTVLGLAVLLIIATALLAMRK